MNTERLPYSSITLPLIRESDDSQALKRNPKMPPIHHTLLTAAAAVTTTSISLGDVTVTHNIRSIESTVNGLDPQDHTSDLMSNHESGSWADDTQAMTPTNGWGATAMASQTSQACGEADITGQKVLFDGEGSSHAFTDDWFGNSTLGSSASSLATMTFVADAAFRWSLDYDLYAGCGGTNDAKAEYLVHLQRITKTGTLSMAVVSDVHQPDDQQTDVQAQGVLNGLLPAGTYRLVIAAASGINLPYMEPGQAGQTGANANWDVTFSISNFSRIKPRRYYNIQPPYDPWIVFEDVLVNLGRERFNPEADLNGDDGVDALDVIKAIERTMDKSSRNSGKSSSANSNRSRLNRAGQSTARASNQTRSHR
ncbi:MAG: hypothetical protein CMJ39_11105 [Phycisphaerae bacterium]|nr:hypothetical protein [Phycisphaerae bacterium]|tara:strand:+ start:868 stop:1968 length:1101 start_codon:yes stop_codon:yes gene_type:complete